MYSHPFCVFVSLKTFPKLLAPSQSVVPYRLPELSKVSDACGPQCLLQLSSKAVKQCEKPTVPRRRQLEHGSTTAAAAVTGCAVEIPGAVHYQASIRQLSVAAVLKAIKHGLCPARIDVIGQLENSSVAVQATSTVVPNRLPLLSRITPPSRRFPVRSSEAVDWCLCPIVARSLSSERQYRGLRSLPLRLSRRCYPSHPRRDRHCQGYAPSGLPVN